MPKDRRDRSVSIDRSWTSPYVCNSSHSKRSLTKSPLETENIKEWEEARCPVCMEHPHNAILLLCSSHHNGCRPFMCDTSYRHSNCFDQFQKASSDTQQLASQQQGVTNPVTPGGSTPVLKLVCPLCRGEVNGWIVVESARLFMNSKTRSCASETCDFSGTYADLRKHARLVHPLVRPSEADPDRQRDWRRLERQRDIGDLLSTLQSSIGEDRVEDISNNNMSALSFDEGGWMTVFFLIRVFRPRSSTRSSSWSGTSRARAHVTIRRRPSARLWGETHNDETRDDDNEFSDGGSGPPLEAGAGFAHDSLESVGQAIEDLGTTVTDIIAPDYYYSDTDTDNINNSIGNRDLGFTKPYSRLDAQVRMIGSDMNTYLNEVEDVVEYDEWRLGFRFDEKVGEIEDIMSENDGVVGEIFREIVPERVDEETFWVRYFYRVYKVKKAEEARVELVKRAIAREGDEELSWDVDEDDYEEDVEAEARLKVEETEETKKDDGEKARGGSETENEDQDEREVDKLEAKLDVKTALEVKTDRDSDISIVSSQPSPDEDGWDEIEDIGSSDENKDKTVSHGSHGSADRAELRKRLTVAEDEEDLTWDIEDDDDETVKE